MRVLRLLVLFFPLTFSFSFLSVIVSVAGGLSFIHSVINPIKCLVSECCENAIQFNADYYRGNLTEKLYGQHIAIERLYFHVKAHMEDPSPRRSLVLSLHGFTGVGKNYAVSILVSQLYKRGLSSRFYHFFDSTVHFVFKDSVDMYKSKVLSAIKGAVQDCERSIFVFDEVHKMPPGILEAIVPLTGYTESIAGVDYRKAIFIFMGNSGAMTINSFVLDSINNGVARKAIQYPDIRRELIEAIYKEPGAFKYSDLVSQYVITAVIPFLPLQENHVRECVEDAARRLGVEATEEMTDFVLSELDWEPEDTRLFSTSGCKLVYDKVGFYLQQRMDGMRTEVGTTSRQIVEL